MAEDEASTPTEDDANECLHYAIVAMVDGRIAPVVPTLPTLQLILWVPEDEQAKRYGAGGFGRLFPPEERR